MVPSRIKMSHAGRNVGPDAVFGLEIGRVLVDPVVDGVDRLDVLLVQFKPECVDIRVFQGDLQPVADDLFAEVPTA